MSYCKRSLQQVNNHEVPCSTRVCVCAALCMLSRPESVWLWLWSCVQFVEFKKFANNGEALAAEVLAELPGQFLAYVRSRNIPLPKAPASAPPTAPPP